MEKMSKAIDVYLERRKTRQYVGRLSRKKRKFVFEYDSIYLYSENPLAIGSDLLLEKARHTSSVLFPSFADRIPSQKNPAYKEYCQDVGISPFEKDAFVLLSTLGKKSPITPFVCVLVQEEQDFSAKDLNPRGFKKGQGTALGGFSASQVDLKQENSNKIRIFRKDLGLSIREFASVFDVSQATIYRIENKKTTGRDTLKKLALYFQYPKMALDRIQNSPALNERKKNQAKNFLKSQIQAVYSAISPFTVTPEDVQKCFPTQAVELLRRLVLLECDRYNIPQNSIHISSNIPAKDGGQDALIYWSYGPDHTNYFPSKYNCFQVKAKKVSPSECKKEIFNGNENQLKEAVQRVLKNKGAYILFSTKSDVAGIYLQVREEAIQEGIKEAGYDPTSIEVKFYDSNIIVDWLNSFPSLVVWFLKEVCGRSVNPWISWQEWSKDRDYGSQFMYHAQLAQKKSALFRQLSQTQQTAHLTGPSGVGKTRLALEIFRPLTDNTKLNQTNLEEADSVGQESHKNDISTLVLYSPAKSITETNIRELKPFRAILIIDDCPLDKAERFHKIALQEDSNLSLLTIGQENPGGTFTHSVKLEPDKEIVTKILSDRQNISNIYIEPLYIKMTEGFPLMAKLLRESGPHVLATDDLPNIRKKMLWGLETPDPQAEKVIKALSIFDTIYMEDALNQEFVVFDTSVRRTKEELKYVAKHIAKMDYDEFYKKIKFFEKRKIIQQHGRFIQARPKPLALWLAMEFLQETPVESTIKWVLGMDQFSKDLVQKKIDSDEQKYQQLPEEEKKEYKEYQEAEQKRYDNMSNQRKRQYENWRINCLPLNPLIESFCKQLSYLNSSSKAKQLAEKLCDSGGLFGQEKVLSTKWGSTCLLYLSVYSEIALKTLKKFLNNKTVEELLTPMDIQNLARRNWIWTLQKLAFKKELYEDSSWLLLKLAEAENEDYSNNATGIWTSHFQLFLSGTQADPKTKFQIIKEINKEGTARQKEIAVQALEKALPQNGYTGNYNSSTIDPQKEWRPATYGELWDYHRKALKLLVQFATEDHPQNIQKKAQDIIAHYLPSLLKIKALHKDVETAVKTIFSYKDPFWPEAVKTLERALKYNTFKKDTEIINKTKALLKLLKPKAENIQQRLFLYVKESNDYQIPNHKKQNKGYSQAFADLIDNFTTYMKTIYLEDTKQTNLQAMNNTNRKATLPTVKSSSMDKQSVVPNLLNKNEVTSIFKSLFHGEQNNTITFAREVAQLLCSGKVSIQQDQGQKLCRLDPQGKESHKPNAEHKAIKWAYKLLTYAQKWSKNPDFDPSFLCGWIAELCLLMPEETQKILDKLAQNLDYKELFIPTYYSRDLSDRDITRLIHFLSHQTNTNIPRLPQKIQGLSTAQKCQKVSTKKMTELIIFLTNKNGEWARSALQIYSYYGSNDIEKKKALLPALFQLLTKKDLLIRKSLKRWDKNMDSHYYKKAVKDLFSLTTEDTKSNKTGFLQGAALEAVSTSGVVDKKLKISNKSSIKKEKALKSPPSNDKALKQEPSNKGRIFAQFFVSTVLQSGLSLYDFCIDDYTIKKVLRQIIAKYPKVVLSEIAKTSQKKLDLLGVQELFKSSDLVDTFSEQMLKKWCAKAPDKMPVFFATHSNLIEFNQKHNQWSWTALAHFLFDNYGDREEVTSAVATNLGRFSWINSMSDYFTAIKQAMMSLREHKHKNIRDFCKNQVSYLQGRINQEKQREKERKELGLL